MLIQVVPAVRLAATFDYPGRQVVRASHQCPTFHFECLDEPSRSAAIGRVRDRRTDWGLKKTGGLFTLPCGKLLRFPSSDIETMKSLGVQAPSARFFLRRCIDETAPDSVDPHWTLGINGTGWKCRGVPQEEVWVCGARVLRPAGTLRADCEILQAGPLYHAGDDLLCTQDQVVHVPTAEVLPQPLRTPSHRGLRHAGLLRCGSPGRSSRGLATDLGSALSLPPLTLPRS